MEPMKYGEGKKSGTEWNNPSLYFIGYIGAEGDGQGQSLAMLKSSYIWLFRLFLKGLQEHYG